MALLTQQLCIDDDDMIKLKTDDMVKHRFLLTGDLFVEFVAKLIAQAGFRLLDVTLDDPNGIFDHRSDADYVKFKFNQLRSCWDRTDRQKQRTVTFLKQNQGRMLQKVTLVDRVGNWIYLTRDGQLSFDQNCEVIGEQLVTIINQIWQGGAR